MKHDIDTGKTFARLVCGVLRCSSAQGHALLCSPLGGKSSGEYGAALRRSAEWYLQAFTVEMLYSGVPQEKGDLRCNVQRQNCASPVFQLHASTLREDVHSGQLFVYQGQGNALRNWQSFGLLPKGVSELAAALLCYAPGYQGLLHAHCQNEAAGACYLHNQEDGNTSYQQALVGYMVRRAGREFYLLADRGNRNARSSRELHYCGRAGKLDRSRSCKEHVAPRRRSWTAYRQLDKSAFQQCVHESIRPVHQARIEMQVLWPLCRRWYNSQSRQGMVAFACASDTGLPQYESWTGAAHGQAANQRGTQGYRVPGFLYQTVQDIRLSKDFGAYESEDSHTRLLESEENTPKRKQLSGYIPAYSLVQDPSCAVHERRISSYRCVRCRYDQDNRKTSFL